MIEYRKASISDIDNLVRVRIDFLLDAKNVQSNDDKKLLLSTNRDYFNSSFRDESLVAWIAIQENSIIAISTISFFKLPPNINRPSGNVAYIGSMFTYPQYRKQGIATKLFSSAVEEAKKRGCTQIELIATDMGRPIYEKYGFKYTSDSMVYITA